MVGERFNEQGIGSFLKNYQKPTLYRIKTSPQLYKKFLSYDDKLGLNYKKLLDNIEDEPPDITLSDNRKDSRGINIAISNYSPLWYCIIGLWERFSGNSYFYQIILPSNIKAILFLASLYFFLGLFYTREEYRDKLSILFIVLLLPIFLQQSVQNTSVVMLEIAITWMFYFLLKHTDAKRNYNGLLAGFLYSVTVLLKFTSLTLMLPIGLFYIIQLKAKSIPKLFVFLIGFSLFPILLKVVFEYDMILNIITGSTIEFSILAGRGNGVRQIFWRIINEMYIFGIPFILLLSTHLLKIRKYVHRNEVLTSYMFIAYFIMLFCILWRSGIARHWLGFMPLLVPALLYVYNYCKEKNKMILLTTVFLLINNLLIIIHDGIIMASELQGYYQVKYW